VARWFLGSKTAPPSYRAARWFLGDCVRRFRGHLALITTFGMASAVLQGVSLVLLSKAVSGSAVHLPVKLPSIGTAPDLTIPVVVVLIVAMLLLSAAFMYVQGRLILRFWRTYQIHSVNRVYDAIRGAVGRGVDATAIEEAWVKPVLNQSPRLGAFTRVVSSSIAPALRFLAFGGVAVATNPFLTLILLVVTVPSAGLALMHFARKASHSARRSSAMSRDANNELHTLLQSALQGDNSAVLSDSGAKPSPFIERARALTGRILYVEQAKFAAGFIAMASLGIFIAYEFAMAPEGDAIWSTTLVYALALLLAFRQLVTVASSISSFGRFYPAIQAQQELVEALEAASSTQDFRARIKRSNLGNITGADFVDEDL
jgi:ABC-type multidrug transport system fused ATPase/permease subunit